jgi:kynurenine formamidase
MSRHTQAKVAPLLCSLVALALAGPTATAQTRERGPWWPSALWGAGDQAGASNWITPEKIREAVSLVKTGKVYELGYPYEPGMPLLGDRTYKMFIAPGDRSFGPDLVGNTEYLSASIGQVGTQFDGPGHIAKRIRMADGTTKDVHYNGFPAEEIRTPYGFRKLGVEQVKPYITRGILIDLAGYKSVERLPNKYVVTLADVRGALARQSMTENSIRPGDAVLFNFGWWRLWPTPQVGDGTWPGIGRDVADWVVGRKAAMVGSDAATDETSGWAVHELNVTHGVFNLEFLNFRGLLADRAYEFLFIFTPLPLKGATGSPGRPLAIR